MSSSLEAGLRVSLAAIAINAVLATVKLVAGLFGNSYALIADAIESFADIGSSTPRGYSAPSGKNGPFLGLS
jgi:divalent metal cation (Fe/Co/Zn/Cd) transporter